MKTKHLPKSLLMLALLAAPSVALADDYYWSVPSGDWSIPGNWGGTLPTGSDDATINNAGTATISQNGATAHSLILGTDTASPGDLQITAGSLSIGAYFIGYDGPGSVTQSAGSVTVADLCFIGYLGNGSYNLSGSASLSVGGVGEILTYGQLFGFNSGHGTFDQSGGTNTTTTLWIPSGNSYTLSGGTLNISGGLQNSGTFDFANGNASLNIAPDSLANIADGFLLNTQNASLTLGANAFLIVPPSFNPSTTFRSFINSGGTVHVQGTPITLTPGQSINGGGNINDFVTCNGGSITQGAEQNLNLYGGFSLSSGSLSVSDIQSNNPAQMTGGILQANYHFVQTNFTQTGGSASYNVLFVGNNGIPGTFNLQEDLTTAAGVWIGTDGGGTFNISGGTYTGGVLAGLWGYASVVNQSGGIISSSTVSSSLQFGSACTYNFTGGTIITNEITSDAGGIFNFGGGTLEPSVAFETSVPMTLTAINGNANIDTAGFKLTLSGPLSGAGGLDKHGLGTLILAANNSYVGPTNIQSGTLTLTSSASISASSTIHIASGATLDASAQPNFSLVPNQTLAGAGTLSGNLTAPVNSHIAPGDSGPGTLTITGELTLSRAALLDFDLSSPDASDEILLPSGTLNLDNFDLTDFNFTTFPGFAPSTYTLIDAASLTGTLGPNLSSTLDGYPTTLLISNNELLIVVAPTPIPEPTSLTILGIGAMALVIRRRKNGIEKVSSWPPRRPRAHPQNA